MLLPRVPLEGPFWPCQFSLFDSLPACVIKYILFCVDFSCFENFGLVFRNFLPQKMPKNDHIAPIFLFCAPLFAHLLRKSFPQFSVIFRAHIHTTFARYRASLPNVCPKNGYACMHLCTYVCMHAFMYACMHVCMVVCMHVCMYV